MVTGRLNFDRGEAEEQERLNRMFIALADEQRRKILLLIRDRELQPGEIVELLGDDVRSLSYHLRILRNSQLVSVRSVGRAHHYRLNRMVWQRAIERLALG